MRLQEPKYDQRQAADEATVVKVERVKPAQGSHVSWRTFGIGLGLTVLIGCIATLLAPLPGLAIMGSLTVALLLGLTWRSLLGVPKAYLGGVKFSAQKLLRYGIILTGVRLNFALVVSSGIQVLLLDVILIAVGIGVMPHVMQRLGLSKRLAFLIAVGQSICGASAVGAIAALFPDVDEDEVSLAVAICGLVGTIGVLLFTVTLHVLPISSHLYGLLAGSTLHEIAQVVAAGAAGSSKAADLAMVVKLTRVMLLAPVALIVAFVFTLRAEKLAGAEASRSFSWKKVPIPWFVFGFLMVGALNSFGLFPRGLTNIILQVSVFLLVMAMAAMGLMVDLSMIRKTGLRALGAALLVFLLFVSVSLLIAGIIGHV